MEFTALLDYMFNTIMKIADIKKKNKKTLTTDFFNKPSSAMKFMFLEIKRNLPSFFYADENGATIFICRKS